MNRFKSINFFLWAIFILCSIGVLVERSTVVEEYTLGEWLINYSAGFVRRGLSGTLILWTSGLLNLKPEFVINSFLVLIFASNLILIGALLLRATATQTLWFLFGPALFLMVPTETMARKENLFFLIFLLHSVLILSKKETWLKCFQQFILPVTGIILALTHEIYVLFIPYHLLLLKFSIHSKKQLRMATLLNLFPLIVFGLATLFPGSYELQAVMCHSLREFGIPCRGGIEAIGMPAQYSAAHSLEILRDLYSVRAYILVFGFTNLVTLILFRKSISILAERNWTKYFLLTNAGIFAACAMGWDFGRWISLYSIHNFIFLASIQPDNKKSVIDEKTNLIQESGWIFGLIILSLSLNTRYRGLYHPSEAPLSASKVPAFLSSGGNLLVNHPKLNSYIFGRKIKYKLAPNKSFLMSDPNLYLINWTEPQDGGRWINASRPSIVFSFEENSPSVYGNINLICSSLLQQEVEIRLNQELVFQGSIDPSLTELKLNINPELLRTKVNQYALDFYFPSFETEKKGSPSKSTFWVKSIEIK